MKFKRDKIISVRVNSNLYNQVQKIIDDRTTVFRGIKRNWYEYIDENRFIHDKFTIADILEKAMSDYIEKLSAVK